MEAIADCAKAIKGVHNNDNNIKMQQLERIEELTRKAIKQNQSIAKVSPYVDAVPLPRMPLGMSDDTRRQMCYMTRLAQQVPRVDT